MVIEKKIVVIVMSIIEDGYSIYLFLKDFLKDYFKRFFFLRWTIFKIIYQIYYTTAFVLCNPGSEGGILTIGPPGKSLYYILIQEFTT